VVNAALACLSLVVAASAPATPGRAAAPDATRSRAPDPSSGGRTSAEENELERKRVEVARQIVRLGDAIRRQVEAGDVEGLAARVPAAGLRCGERIVPREKVLRDLRSPRTWLHGVFFGGPGHAPIRGTPGSLRDFFRQAREIAVLVAFREDAAAGPIGRPCLDYRAPNVGTPGAPLCFETRGGRWWFTESLYPCGG
jgi:hypothetical protein